MELTKKHYVGIAFALIVGVLIILSQFPLTEPELPTEYNDPNFYENIGEYDSTQDYKDYAIKNPLPGTEHAEYHIYPSEEKVPLNFDIQTTDCLGEIKNNAFIPDERNPTQEQLDNPVLTIGKQSLKFEFFGEMLCNAKDITVEAYLSTDGFITISELDEGTTEMIWGPTTDPIDEQWPCLCSYKTTVNITGLESKPYTLIFGTKGYQDFLYETVQIE